MFSPSSAIRYRRMDTECVVPCVLDVYDAADCCMYRQEVLEIFPTYIYIYIYEYLNTASSRAKIIPRWK